MFRVLTESSNDPSPWSEPLEIEAGLLKASDWSAHLIAPGALTEATGLDSVAYLRREFELKEAPESARLYATAHGVYEIEIKRVSSRGPCASAGLEGVRGIKDRIRNGAVLPGDQLTHRRIRSPVVDSSHGI